MTQKKLLALLAACIVIGVLFVLSDRTYTSVDAGKIQPLLEADLTNKVSGIKVERGEKAVELVSKDGNWVLPARWNYPADSGRIRSLLLQLSDLELTQKVTDNPKRQEALGVDEAAVKKESTRVTLLDDGGKPIRDFILGAERKGRGGSGQYLRHVNSNDIYLIGSNIAPANELNSWLDTEIVNVLPAVVTSVEQFSTSAEGVKRDFKVEAKKNGSVTEYAVDPPIVAPETLDQMAATQVTGGLQTVQLTDVLKNDDPAAKDLNFDSRTVYQLQDGLQYTVSTAEKGEKSYLRVSVAFDPAVAEATKAQAATQKEEEAKAKKESGEKEGAAATDPPPPASPDVVVSSAEAATKANERFAPWIYEVAKYQADKFRKTRSDLLKKEEVQPPVPPAG